MCVGTAECYQLRVDAAHACVLCVFVYVCMYLSMYVCMSMARQRYELGVDAAHACVLCVYIYIYVMYVCLYERNCMRVLMNVCRHARKRANTQTHTHTSL